MDEEVLISDEEFQRLVDQAVESLPKEFQQELKNIAIIVEDEPNIEHRRLGRLHPYQELFGLYQGVPLPKRAGAILQMPDRIFIFKNPIVRYHRDADRIREQIRSTVEHEIGHYFGLSERDLRRLHR